MTTMRVSDWCAGFPGLDERKRLGAFEHEGTRIECATDGRALAMVDAGTSSAMPLCGDDAAKFVTTARDLWTRPVGAVQERLVLRDLIAAIGDVVRWRRVECHECRGSGRHRDADGDCACSRCACGDCEGEKYVCEPPVPKKRFVEGFVTRFDANLMGLALSSIHGADPSEEVTLFDLDPSLTCVVVAAQTWRVVVRAWRVALMGVRITDDEKGMADLFAKRGRRVETP